MIGSTQKPAHGRTLSKLIRVCVLSTLISAASAFLISILAGFKSGSILLLVLFTVGVCVLLSGVLLRSVYRELLRPIRIQQSYNIYQLEECTPEACPVMRIPEHLIPDSEIGHVMRLRNRMLDKLQNTLMELRDNYEKVQKLEKLQSDLTKMIIHDLRSPSAVVITSLDLLAQTDRLTKRQQSHMQLARRGMIDLMRMISNLLDISRLEEGKLELHRSFTSIKEVVEQSVHDFTDAGLHGRKTIRLAVSSSLPEVSLDRDLITRVLRNLLSNAIRHTQEDGHIHISTTFLQDERRVQVSVADDGIGIPEEYHERIFEKFEQVRAREAGERTGTGLGLAFCKLAVEAHGGKIWVESKPGKGSTFHFTLSVDPIDRALGCSEDIQMLPRKFGRLDEKVTGPVEPHDRSEDQVGGKIVK